MRPDFGAGTLSSQSCAARGRAGFHALDFGAAGTGNAVCLGVFLNLVDHHSARLVVRKRVGVIAVARMHPHT